MLVAQEQTREQEWRAAGKAIDGVEDLSWEILA